MLKLLLKVFIKDISLQWIAFGVYIVKQFVHWLAEKTQHGLYKEFVCDVIFFNFLKKFKRA